MLLTATHRDTVTNVEDDLGLGTWGKWSLGGKRERLDQFQIAGWIRLNKKSFMKKASKSSMAMTPNQSSICLLELCSMLVYPV